MAALDDEVLAVLSLLAEPTSVSQLTKVLGKLHETSRGGRKVEHPKVRAICEAHERAGKLVDFQGRGHSAYFVPGEIAVSTLVTEHAKRRLGPLFEGLDGERALPWTIPQLGWRSHLRVAIARGDPQGVEHATEDARTHTHNWRDVGAHVIDAIGLEIPALFVEAARPDVRDAVVETCLEVGRTRLIGLSDDLLRAASLGPPKIRKSAAQYLAMHGHPQQARALVGSSKEALANVEVVTAFLAGDWSRAAVVGLQLCETLKRKHKTLVGEAGVFHALACIAHSSVDPRALGHATIAVHEALDRNHLDVECYLPMLPLVAPERPGGARPFASGLARYVAALCAFWARQPPSHAGSDRRELPPGFDESLEAAEAGGFVGLAACMRDLQGAYARPEEARGLPTAFRQRASWEIALDRLEVAVATVSTNTPAARRGDKPTVLWELTFDERGGVTLQARSLRSARARRGVALTAHTLLRKAERGELDLTAADLRILDGVYTERESWGEKPRSHFGTQSIVGLIGHPHVVDADGARLTIEAGSPTLRLESTNEGGARLVTYPVSLARDNVAMQCDDPGRYSVFERPAAWESVLAGVPRAGLEVPSSGIARLKSLLVELSGSTPVDAVGISLGDKEVSAQQPLLVRLIWDGSCLELAVRAAPFGAQGPHYRVGTGSVRAVHRSGAELVTATRDLDDERQRFARLQAAVEVPWDPDTAEVTLDEVGLALCTVESLTQLGEEIRLAWPSRELKLRHTHSRQDTDLRTTATLQAEQWLSVDVALHVDEDTVLTYQQLLAGRDPGGAFVRLDEDTFVTLTTAMRERLDAIGAVASGRGQEIRLHATAACALALDSDDSGVQFDPGATALLASIRKSLTLTPRLPASFNGELRDYQKEGWRWLVRLCDANLGGCLADDMGLGKTIQTLALLCLRQKLGPALVVCPTSVLGNWGDECQRFAPKLRVHTLPDTGRKAVVDKLGARDVLIVSYGLLVREQEMLCSVQFGTAVFDEAQALKTSTSQRAKAAFRIKAHARVTLTGTPIENHLGELWSVMHATVPGLLGTRRQFEERFARPILRGDAGALDRLRQFMDPFLLRRTRREVLTELPPLTEITIRVPPSPQQRAYYEAIRLRALKHLESVRSNPGKERMRLLAEITRLRQAAVDPRLVDADLGPEGAKLDAVCQRVVALHADGHSVLVFTQFLGCIRYLQEAMGEAGLEVLTLDGSTSAAARSDRIEAFQRGDADVFIMSLKAGGVGVNLTRADYVIHVDPWWNPATEDQATARSHRMGQARPVTVYRMLSEGTIEERIVAMHEAKRELAEDLLGNMDKARKLDLDALRSLLQ